jgi:hypothetical protein
MTLPNGNLPPYHDLTLPPFLVAVQTARELAGQMPEV